MTGTTDDYADAWFAGYTPQLVAAVWVGFPEGAIPMRDIVGFRAVAGGTVPALIWHDVMAAAHSTLPPQPFPEAPNRAPSITTTVPPPPPTTSHPRPTQVPPPSELPPPAEEPPPEDEPPQEEPPPPQEEPPPPEDDPPDETPLPRDPTDGDVTGDGGSTTSTSSTTTSTTTGEPRDRRAG